MLPQRTQQLCKVASSLNWVSTQTILDMTNSLIKDAPVRDLIAAIKFVKLLKSKDLFCHFQKFYSLSKAALIFLIMHHLQT